MRASNCNLKAIHIFVTVAEHSSFRKASEALNRSQSAVSTQIKLLEEQIGVALFHRTTRRVDLTPEGRQFFEHAKRAMTSLDAGLRYIEDTAKLETGFVPFACLPSIAASVLPSILMRFQQRRPNIKIQVMETSYEQILNAVGSHEAQFGIGPIVDSEPDFDFTPIMTERIFAMVPKRYGFAGSAGFALKEVAAIPVIMASMSAVLRAEINQALADQGIAVENFIEVSQVQTMMAFAAAGLGVALVPRLMVDWRMSDVVDILPLVEPELSRTLSLIRVKGNFLSPAATELSDMICRELEQYRARDLTAG
jgi:DNA-binding transcriptional LysR family regulator